MPGAAKTVSERHGLRSEQVSLTAIAQAHRTPTYVYSQSAIEAKIDDLSFAFRSHPTRICYSVKANSNLAILKCIAQRGGGFDIVSAGELARVTRIGAASDTIVFSGVGKTDDELVAALDANIFCFNVESEDELLRLNALARQRQVKAPFSLRINPDIDAKTHPSIATGLKTSKFGIPVKQALRLYRKSVRWPGVVAHGIDCHIGSQITSLAPLRQTARLMVDVFRSLNDLPGLKLTHIDLGGGLGVVYRDEATVSLADYAKALLQAVKPTGALLLLEPGRSVVAEAGVLLTRVVAQKTVSGKKLLVVDAGMNDLLRPALYDAFHQVKPVTPRGQASQRYDVVGPVCESTDVLAKRRLLPVIQNGDLLAILTTGAYGMSMASQYNSRPKPAEVLVKGKTFRLIRARETYAELMKGEMP
jgi:diaminopimelate decarboxylase